MRNFPAQFETLSSCCHFLITHLNTLFFKVHQHRIKAWIAIQISSHGTLRQLRWVSFVYVGGFHDTFGDVPPYGRV